MWTEKVGWMCSMVGPFEQPAEMACGIYENTQFEGILPKGPYPPCLRMADRALLAGYPRIASHSILWVVISYACLRGLLASPKSSNMSYLDVLVHHHDHHMMTSSNGNIFRVTGHLCGKFTGPGEFPTQRPVTRSFDVCFDLRLNKRLSKQS